MAAAYVEEDRRVMDGREVIPEQIWLVYDYLGAQRWFVSTKMPYFSPAVIHDGAHTLKAGEILSLKYRFVLSPTVLSKDAAEKLWNSFITRS